MANAYLEAVDDLVAQVLHTTQRSGTGEGMTGLARRLARALGTAMPTQRVQLYQWQNREDRPSAAALLALVHLTGFRVDDFLSHRFGKSSVPAGSPQRPRRRDPATPRRLALLEKAQKRPKTQANSRNVTT